MPLNPGDQNAVEQLRFLCSKTSVPEAVVNTIAVNGHESMGVTREQPTFIQYSSPFSITVISDRDYTVYKACRRWFDTIARNANPNVLGGFGGSSQRVAYYDTFRRQITLRKLELQGGVGSAQPNEYMEPFAIQFNNAYPVRMGEISLSSEDTDSKVEFNVDFAYETYTFESGTPHGGLTNLR